MAPAKDETCGSGIRALAVALLLAAVMLPYWWLGVQWSEGVLAAPDARFTFATTTFLLVLIIAISVFLIRYYQLMRTCELTRKTEDLQRSQEALALTNRKLSLLSSITRHDINNQIMALRSFQFLSRESGIDPEKVREYLAAEEQIAETIGRQIRFTKDYEDLGIKAPEWQNPGSLVRLAAKDLPLGNIRLDIRQENTEIYADPLLVRVFYNLVDNALRYGGSGLTTITLEAVENESGLVVIFRDDGAGISPEEKTGLFSKGHGKNTGLGLFLTREILSITGITITETGTPGKGARFEIMVPRGAYRFSEPADPGIS